MQLFKMMTMKNIIIQRNTYDIRLRKNLAYRTYSMSLTTYKIQIYRKKRLKGKVKNIKVVGKVILI